MFNTVVSSFLLALASVSFASPVFYTRQTGLNSACAGFEEGSFDTASNFTLAAFPQPLTRDATPTPLAITLYETSDGVNFYALSTEASAPATEFPNLSLISGGLIGNGISATAIGMNVPNGFEPDFYSPANADQPPAQVYCGVPYTPPSGISTGHSYLSVNNDIDDFSLCTVTSSGLVNVVYKPTELNEFGYDINTCTSIYVQIIA